MIDHDGLLEYLGRVRPWQIQRHSTNRWTDNWWLEPRTVQGADPLVVVERHALALAERTWGKAEPITVGVVVTAAPPNQRSESIMCKRNWDGWAWIAVYFERDGRPAGTHYWRIRPQPLSLRPDGTSEMEQLRDDIATEKALARAG